MKLVIHIGGRKTGSTSIQDTLATKGWSCDDVALTYMAAQDNLPLANSLMELAPIKQRRARFSNLNTRLAKVKADVAVLSSEGFESVFPEVLKNAIDKYLPDYSQNVQIIGYVRPHGDRILSGYAEDIKQGSTDLSLEQYHEKTLANGYFMFHERYKYWREEFGEQFTLRPLVRSALHNKCVVQDFLAFALGTDNFTLQQKAASNVSMSLEDLSIARRFQQMATESNTPPQVKSAIGWELSRLIGDLPRHSSTKLAMPSKLAELVTEAYRDDAMKQDADFYVGSPMLDSLLSLKSNACDTPQSLCMDDYFDEDVVRTLTIWMQLALKLTLQSSDT